MFLQQTLYTLFLFVVEWATAMAVPTSDGQTILSCLGAAAWQRDPLLLFLFVLEPATALAVPVCECKNVA